MIITVKYNADLDTKLEEKIIKFMKELEFLLFSCHASRSGGGCRLSFEREAGYEHLPRK